ncbi:MAG: helix-turn-helix domain-containing protein [Verrucomicrobiota bacterium]
MRCRYFSICILEQRHSLFGSPKYPHGQGCGDKLTFSINDSLSFDNRVLDSSNPLGQHLRSTRLKHGLDQKQLGRKLRVSYQTIGNWEAGIRESDQPKHIKTIVGFIGFDPRPAPRTMGEELHQLRTRKGLTAAAYARSMEVDPGTYGRWERDEKLPHGICLQKLKRALGFEVAFADTSSLGFRLRQKRQTLGLTQSQLGELLGACKPAISLWERNLRKPEERFAVKIHDFFDELTSTSKE